MTGTVGNAVKLRVVASEENVKRVAEVLVDALENEGFQVIEWSQAYECREPDEDKKRVYVTALSGPVVGPSEVK